MNHYAPIRLADLCVGPPRRVFEDGTEPPDTGFRRRYPNFMRWLDRRPHVAREFWPLAKRLPSGKLGRVLDALDWAALEGSS